MEIGANTTIDRGALGDTVIRRGVKLDNLIHIAHNCIVGEDSAFAAQVGLSGSTTVGARCMFGGQAGFSGHIKVEDDVVVLAKSGVHTDLKSGEKYIGIPARPAREAFRIMALESKLGDLFARIKQIERRVKPPTS